MKLFLVGLVLSTIAFFFQQAVRTESANILYKNYTAATTGDTLFTKAAAAGGSIPHAGVTGYLVSVTFNTTVASDSTQFLNGVGSVGHIIHTASPPVLPYTVTYNVRLDTSLVVVKKKASDITISYRVTQN